jgi:hypothetical protein
MVSGLKERVSGLYEGAGTDGVKKLGRKMAMRPPGMPKSNE